MSVWIQSSDFPGTPSLEVKYESIRLTDKIKLAFVVIATLITTSSARATIVDVDSTSATGTIIQLAAGTYTVSYATNGAYSAWSPWGSSSGCDSGGMNCQIGFLNAFAIDFGYGIGMF